MQSQFNAHLHLSQVILYYDHHLGYDFSKVCRWFAERSDLIFLMFDCSKLDISDEFKSVIEELQPHEDKVHCILNKADQLDSESLMRVYGALLWSMGRIFKGAEVTRVYVGTFADGIAVKEEHKKLFTSDKKVLLEQLEKLPNSCCLRKINEIVKRIRLLLVHVCILGHLKSQMPRIWGKESAQKTFILNIKQIFEEVKRLYNLAEGDFPKIEEFAASLQLCDFSKFPRTDKSTLTTLQSLINDDIPKIIKYVASVDKGIGTENEDRPHHPVRQPSLFRISDDHRGVYKKNQDRNGSITLLILVSASLILAIVVWFYFSNDTGTLSTYGNIFTNRVKTSY